MRRGSVDEEKEPQFLEGQKRVKRMDWDGAVQSFERALQAIAIGRFGPGLLIPRVRYFTQRLEQPFLLENNVYYFRYPDQDMAEEDFLNALCRETGCGVLLDLHNLHTNAANHGFSAEDYLDRLDLANVVEIHIAGGVPMMGFHTDSHTGPVLEPVWHLLDRALPRAINLRGVTFEFHESSLGRMGEDGVFAQLAHARAILAAHSTPARAFADVAAGIPAGRG